MTDAERLARTLNAQLDRDIAEQLANGVTEPAAMLDALVALPTWAEAGFTLDAVARKMQAMLRDTTAMARQIAKARAAGAMLDVLETGDTKDKIAVLKGIQVLGDVIEHKGEVAHTFNVNTFDGPPPKVGS